MSETRVVNLRHEHYDVNIGRPSIFGNPFVIGLHGTREEVIEQFRTFAVGPSRAAAELRAHLPELRGKQLGCYCKPAACHGDVLVEMIAALAPEDAQ